MMGKNAYWHKSLKPGGGSGQAGVKRGGRAPWDLATTAPFLSVSCPKVSPKMSFEKDGSVPKTKEPFKKALLGNGQAGLFQP